MTATAHRLLLVRHAQGSLGTDDYDRLSPTGHTQAERLGAHLRGIDGAARIVRGGLRRHRETADSIGDRQAIDAELDEYRVDHLLTAAFDPASGLGMTPPPPEAMADPAAYLQTFLELFPEVLSAWQTERLECPVNGRWRAFDERVRRAGGRLVEAMAESDTVTAVTSAGVISTLATVLLEQDLDWQRRLNVALYNASVTELHRLPDGRWRVERINCVAHLPGDQHTLA
ncbi:histidine phosphatase family protein [Wenzhouxiangella sp. XN79A]|uniref:histidine phosphatase family protein n=1 Tax=Wenzhouxiangella sp. XN79A TaxID=2724193 RepID=UPI00144ABA1B|nr:histidine phosphatase family protein [Wenzhouxiangella sp. XN79A]NKI34097.1 histidine phosphatase family protein [Wenzhouxiangella sp. XN79A]